MNQNNPQNIEKKDNENEPYYLKELNSRQKEAVLATDGQLLILAGAGAGKTKTVAHRILHLIRSGVRPSSILAITFTNKAGKEMRERVYKLIENDESVNRPVSLDEKPFISTFHSLGVHIIKEQSVHLGLPRHFSIFDRSDSKSAVKTAMESIGIDPKKFEPGKILGLISKNKGDGVTLEEYEGKDLGYVERITLDVWEEYEKILKSEKALDFDDLLLKTRNLLRDEKIRLHYQNIWRYIHIDEYQDTNRVQYEIAKLLAEKEKNITVVGDMDQCLIENTKITLVDGSTKNIEDIKRGDEILSNYGSGDYRGSKVINTYKKKSSGDLIKIKTESGKEIISTPEHIHFAGFILGPSRQRYFTYLMYKIGKGFRIGVSQIYTNGQIKPVVGLIQRSNHEHADKLWIINSYDNPNDARILEYTLSLKYSIPTLPFVARKNVKKNNGGMVHDQKIIDQVFNNFDTSVTAELLMHEHYLDFDFPHHQPQSRNSNRRNLTITLCGDRRGKNPFHRISMIGNDDEGRKKIESIGLSVRKAKINSKSWRFECCNVNYGELINKIGLIKKVFNDLNIIKNARLGGHKPNPKDSNSLPFIKAEHVVPGMVFFNDEGKYESIVYTERIKNQKSVVYDINIEKTHNFIANGITTHNSIYSWRGADFKNIMRFEKDYPEAKVILLEQNYRSTKNILAVANAIIKKNTLRKEKNLFTENEDGHLISMYGAGDEKDEANFVAKTSKMLISQGVLPQEIAVLYRANFQSRNLEESFLRKEIPYELLGTKFFERKEIKDVLSYLKASLNPDSLSDLKRIINVPARGIGKVTILKIFEGKENELSGAVKEKINAFRELLLKIKEKALKEKPSETIKYIISASGIEYSFDVRKEDDAERIENIRELVSTASMYDNMPGEVGIEKLLEHTSLSSDQDTLTEDKKGVRLMTVHASKGLEFDYVFITGLEEDLFPHKKMDAGMLHKEQAEEERRLFYVALTRARKKIFLTHASIRTIFGSKQFNIPSEFLGDIDESFIQNEDHRPDREKIIYLDF